MGEEDILRVKEPVLILISPLLLAFCWCGSVFIFWTVFERGRRQKPVCMDLQGKMLVYSLKGKAENPVSETAKGALRLPQLHGDEPRESFHPLSPCRQKVPVAGAVR